MIVTDILNEIVSRLSVIVSGNTTPAGNMYVFTPAAIYKGRTMLSAEVIEGPVYSVLRQDRVREDRNKEGSVNVYSIEYVVYGRAAISDYSNPVLTAEQCIADICEAVLEGGTVESRQRHTMAGLCADFSYDSDRISPFDKNDQSIGFSVTFAAFIQGKRGHFH